MKKPTQNNSNTKKSSTKETPTIEIRSFKVIRTHMFDNGGVTFDLELNGVSIYGCRVVEGKNGDFISLPQRKGGDGKYYSIVWCKFSEKDQKDILAEVERQINGFVAPLDNEELPY